MECSGLEISMQFQSDSRQFLFRTFKRHYHKVKEVYATLVNVNGSFSYQITYRQSSIQTKLENSHEEETIRFVVLMRRFLNPLDILYYKKPWSVLKEQFPEAISAGRVSQLEGVMEKLTKGAVGININQQDFTAENVYHTIANGDYFGKSDDEAAALLQTLANMPLGHLLIYEFYNYNVAFFHVTSMLFDILLEVGKDERYSSFFHDEVITDKRCIYCLSDTGMFTSDEHIVPESLGNYDTVLRKGFVCDTCNNEVLSRLDEALLDSDLLGFLKTLFMPYTKAGKLPQAEYQNFSMKKTRPNHIVFIEKTKKKSFTFDSKDENGYTRFSIKMKGRKKFDPIIIGRALYKIGLGMVAFYQGKEIACENKYDAARGFIRGERYFHNNLLMSENNKPHPHITSRWDTSWGGTCFLIDIYGLVFLFNLEETPEIAFSEEQLKQMNVISFSLQSPMPGD
jgi:hypothetical protein